LQDIAEKSGVSIHTVRQHKREGLLDPSDLADVSRYISGWRAIKKEQVSHQTHHTDAFGDPV